MAGGFCSTVFPFYRCGAAKRQALGAWGDAVSSSLLGVELSQGRTRVVPLLVVLRWFERSSCGVLVLLVWYERPLCGLPVVFSPIACGLWF